MVMEKIGIFTDDEKKLIHNYYKAKFKKETEGYDGEMNKCWVDELLVYDNQVYIERNYTTRDGDYWDSEDVSDVYLEMEEKQ